MALAELGLIRIDILRVANWADENILCTLASSRDSLSFAPIRMDKTSEQFAYCVIFGFFKNTILLV